MISRFFQSTLGFGFSGVVRFIRDSNPAVLIRLAHHTPLLSPWPTQSLYPSYPPRLPVTMNARPHKQSMSELKLRRLAEHNQRLKEDLNRPRIKVSEASAR